jgi:hypothetical protein
LVSVLLQADRRVDSCVRDPLELGWTDLAAQLLQFPLNPHLFSALLALTAARIILDPMFSPFGLVMQ